MYRNHIVFVLFFVIFALRTAYAYPPLQPGDPVSDTPPAYCATVKDRVMPKGELAVVILEVDLMSLAACEGTGANSIFQQLLRRVQLGKYTTATISRDSAIERFGIALVKDQHIDDACRDSDPCTLATFINNDEKLQSSDRALAGAGKLWWVPLHVGIKGHYEITGVALRDMLSGKALEITQDASQDADFFEWTHPEAHAQSPYDPSTLKIIRDDEGVTAKDKYIYWQRKAAKQVIESCTKNSPDAPRQALYWLGYSVHGIQDLVFHEGISNVEHSYRDNIVSEGVDFRKYYSEKYDMAVQATAIYVEELRNRLPGNCWTRMEKWQGSGWYSVTQKSKFHPKRDLSYATWREYRGLGERVAEALRRDITQKSLYFLSDEELWLSVRNPRVLSELLRKALWR